MGNKIGKWFYSLSCTRCHRSLPYHPEVIGDTMIGPVTHQCNVCMCMLECEAFDSQEKRDDRIREVQNVISP